MEADNDSKKEYTEIDLQKFGYHTLMARATLFPNKSWEEVVEIVKEQHDEILKLIKKQDDEMLEIIIKSQSTEINTPINELIREINEEIKKNDNDPVCSDANYSLGLAHARVLAYQKLVDEKQIIINAYEAGTGNRLAYLHSKKKDSEQYYENLIKKQD